METDLFSEEKKKNSYSEQTKVFEGLVDFDGPFFTVLLKLFHNYVLEVMEGMSKQHHHFNSAPTAFTIVLSRSIVLSLGKVTKIIKQ